MSYDLTPAAIDDVVTITDSGRERFGEPAATAFADKLFESFDHLAAFPRSGHFIEVLGTRELRFWPCGPYLIAYLWRASPIVIVRIVHGHRDLRFLF